MTEKTSASGGGFVCVDPKWGDRLGRFDEPGLDAAVRQGLADHLFICDACQLARAAEVALAGAIQAGQVQLTPQVQPTPEVQPTPAARLRPVHLPWLQWGGACAVAASLLLMLFTPPTGRQAGGLRRGESSGPHFQSPVEGEVLYTDVPRLKWSAIPGASSYQVQVSEVGGPYLWSAATDVPSITIPADQALPDDGIFRGVVQPVPSDLAGVADVSVAFSKSGWREFAVYRAGASPVWLRALSLLGLAGLGLGLGLQTRHSAVRG